MEGMRGNERSLNKKINTCVQMLAAAKVENEKLIEIAVINTKNNIKKFEFKNIYCKN